MSCSCDGCIKRASICVPRGDSKRIVFSVLDKDGDEVDLTGVTDIAFVVSEGQVIGGNMEAGGSILFEKRLSDGDVVIAGSLYQFVVVITRSDSIIPAHANNYFEARIYRGTDATTVVAGIYKTKDTQLGAN